MKWQYKRAKCDPNDNINFFQKLQKKKSPSGRGLRPQTPSVIRLSYTSLLTKSPNLDILEKFFNFWFKFSSFNNILVTCQLRPQIVILHFIICLSNRKSLFLKISDDVIACDLQFRPSQLKILVTPMCDRRLNFGKLAYTRVAWKSVNMQFWLFTLFWSTAAIYLYGDRNMQ